MRQVRRAADASMSSQRSAGIRGQSADVHVKADAGRRVDQRAGGRRGSDRPVRGCREAHVLAWKWALANWNEDGSLPSGKDIGREHGRHERWDRVMKKSGLADKLDPQIQI
jgi:hypothetical protein